MKFLKVIYYLFIAFVVLVVLLLISSALPIPGGIKTFVVLSGSMEPTIRTGDVIVVKPASEYKINDIITFGPYGKTKPPTTHRIIGTEGENFVTQGDANNSPDGDTVSPKSIIGEVILDIPYAGYIVSTAKKPYGFAVLVVVPAAIIITDEVKKILSELKKRIKKPDA